MARKMTVVHIHRLTLVRRSKATAKHPDTRWGVVETVKALPVQPEPGQPPATDPDPYPHLRRWRWQ